MSIKTEADALLALDKLHDLMVQTPVSTAIITSLFYEGPDYIVVLGSRKSKHEADKGLSQTFKFKIPKIPTANNITYTGTGDLFAALLLGWSVRCDTIVEACEKVIAVLGAVLKRTYAERLKGGKGAAGQPERGKELQLIQSKHDFENPSVEFRAEIV